MQGIVSRCFVFASDEKILMNMSALLLFAALPFSAIAIGITQVMVSRGKFKSDICFFLLMVPIVVQNYKSYGEVMEI